MANGLKIEKGDIVIFHGSFKGKRYTRIQGRAEESGDTRFKKVAYPGTHKTRRNKRTRRTYLWTFEEVILYICVLTNPIQKMKDRTIVQIDVVANVGLKVTHQGERDKKGTYSKITETISAIPKPEFDKAMKKLGNAMIKAGGPGYFQHVSTEYLKGADLKKVLQGISRKTRVTQVKFVYDEGILVKVKFKGSFMNHVNESGSFEVPQIDLTDVLYGFESSLKQELETVLIEAHSYLNSNYNSIEPTEEVAEEASDELPDEPVAEKPKAAAKKKVATKHPEMMVERAA